MTADDLQQRLQQLKAECARLHEENKRLREHLSNPNNPGLPSSAVLDGQIPPAAETPGAVVDKNSPAKDKLVLYRVLFRGREDVYALRWEGRNQRSVYAPACANEWRPGICNKPKVSCGDCSMRELRPLTDQVLTDHLAGRITVGLYPMRTDDSCLLLAMDFDKATWQDDVQAVRNTCDELSVPCALERSRSGRGAHMWFFFSAAVAAVLARRLGCFLLTRTMERRPELGLTSYDRLFPSQDTLTKGGFGNLIALPLQGTARANGNTVFLDTNLQPFPDQWRFLASLSRLDQARIEQLVGAAVQSGGILGFTRHDEVDEASEVPWELLPSQRARPKPLSGPFPAMLSITMANMLYLDTDGLPPALYNRLKRLAAFPNPAFYEAQARRFSIYNIPRLICCAVEEPGWLCLPRGCLDEVLVLCRELGIAASVEDKRFPGTPLSVDFHGILTPLQQQAATTLLAADNGILAATTAFGKTVVAAYCLARRKVNTLVLVHRRHLLDQWRERLAAFLKLPAKAIGTIGGGRNKPTGKIDIGIIQALNRRGIINDVVAGYGQVIIDECHTTGAVSFEQVLREARAKYVMGLTATPTRRDGHHPIIIMQCGPIRFRVDARHHDARLPLDHLVIPRDTSFAPGSRDKEWTIQELYSLLAADVVRNELILLDIRLLLQEKRSPLVLTERNSHIDLLASRVAAFVPHCLVFRGGMGIKQRRSLFEQLRAIPPDEPRILLATGRYIGEGFDDARLDTLLLTMPISWRGTLQQYAGRLNRHYAAKRDIRIYDYVDQAVPMLRRMFSRRERGYRALGYRFVAESAPTLF